MFSLSQRFAVIRAWVAQRFPTWRSQAGVRHWLFLAACAVCLIAIAGVTLALLSPKSAPTTTPSRIGAQLATASATATLVPTIRPTVTRGPTPPVTKVVSNQPVTVPPPPPQPTPPPATPTATPCPSPTATATPSPTATATATSGPAATATGTAAGALAQRAFSPCAPPCGVPTGNNPSVAQIRTALSAAADQYGLPHNLLYGFAWEESQWHEDVTSCDGGVGLLQIQYYYADYFNHSPVINGSGCGLSDTNYNIYTLTGNADLGAKVIKYLACYYLGVAATKYQANGRSFPDTSSTPSLCAELYTNNTNGPTATLYQDLPSAVGAGWSCPLDPAQGITSAEALDYTISAYNAGQTAIYNCGCIPNLGYVGAVEEWVTQFQNGQLP